ncbi:hypothetical protein IMSHALPRED_007112 [Imshaugia aleurites]|uniref:Uncharacterized protein n=1 Tax=Imshaugia aleurites TaxID=172621 RepID=A0A8H3ITF8_9LECA|nr:hypothetical protein IMSHALPRED_007112 [Imshaugia aleurites]
MSLLRTIAIRAPRAPLATTNSVRVCFSTSPFAKKDSTAKETIESVNKSVGNAAVKGIEKGRKFRRYLTPTMFSDLAITAPSSETSHLHSAFTNANPPPLSTEKATENLKSTVGLNAQKAEGSAKEMAGEAKGKAEEVAGEAKGKTHEVAGQAKGKAEEVKGKM